MLSKLLHVFGRSFGILMGWRRTHRPGDLTARIFIEHDRAMTRLAQNASAPIPHKTSNLLSIKSASHSHAHPVRASRIAIRADRISLVADRAVARIARTSGAAAKQNPRRVVWLDISRTPKSIAAIAPTSGTTSTASSNGANIIALHNPASAVKTLKSKAA